MLSLLKLGGKLPRPVVHKPFREIPFVVNLYFKAYVLAVDYHVYIQPTELIPDYIRRNLHICDLEALNAFNSDLKHCGDKLPQLILAAHEEYLEQHVVFEIVPQLCHADTPSSNLL
jgi:hypothetical protein